MTMKIRFWGVRGSIASPGPETARVGGNTSCVEVITGGAGDTRIVLDAGTGMRALGTTLMREMPGSVDVTVLLSHLHWDHIQGIPFFTPLYVPGTRVKFVAGANNIPLRDSLRKQMSAPHFPIDLADLPSTLSFQEIRDRGRFTIGNGGEVEVAVAKANHPDSVHAYRLTHEGRSIVYATDTEHYSCVDRRLVTLAQDVDVLIYDAQYTPEEYSGASGMSRVGWGHSTHEAATELARAANVKQLVLFHHDPSRDDDAVERIEHLARGRFAQTIAAREGTLLSLEGARTIEAA